eukprot:2405191-Rhodomonas_salina.1
MIAHQTFMSPQSACMLSASDNSASTQLVAGLSDTHRHEPTHVQLTFIRTPDVYVVATDMRVGAGTQVGSSAASDGCLAEGMSPVRSRGDDAGNAGLDGGNLHLRHVNSDIDSCDPGRHARSPDTPAAYMEVHLSILAMLAVNSDIHGEPILTFSMTTLTWISTAAA